MRNILSERSHLKNLAEQHSCWRCELRTFNSPEPGIEAEGNGICKSEFYKKPFIRNGCSFFVENENREKARFIEGNSCQKCQHRPVDFLKAGPILTPWQDYCDFCDRKILAPFKRNGCRFFKSIGYNAAQEGTIGK